MRAGPRLVLAAALVAFAATRIAMWTSIDPIFDADTYKYLGAADSLWRGLGWPPVFLKMHEGGGALHALPGHALLILAVWNALGAPTLTGVVVLQGLLSMLALAAVVELLRREYGLGAAALAAMLVAASPSLAWLDQLLMPDAPGAALYALAIFLALRSAAAPRFGLRVALAAAVCGVLAAGNVLLHATAQVFVPFPVLAVLGCLGLTRAAATWAGVYALTFTMTLLPWMAHNHQVHGSWTLAASTGRSLYFSGVWSDTIDRRAELADLGSSSVPDVNSSYEILDARFQKLLDGGLDIRQADAAMGRLAVRKFSEAGLARIVEGRAAILAGLFRENAFGRNNMTLADRLSWYLNNMFAADPMRFTMEERWNYELSPAVVALIRSGREEHAGQHEWFRRWVAWLRFDDEPLAVVFVAATAVLLAGLRRHRIALLCWAAPVYAWLAMFTIFGAPLYRYQASLHLQMLVVIALALWQLARPLSRDA